MVKNTGSFIFSDYSFVNKIMAHGGFNFMFIEEAYTFLADANKGQKVAAMSQTGMFFIFYFNF